jgi:hypothetical protein
LLAIHGAKIVVLKEKPAIPSLLLISSPKNLFKVSRFANEFPAKTGLKIKHGKKSGFHYF